MDYPVSFFHAADPNGYMPSQIINMPANITMAGQSTTWQSKYATLGVGLTNSLVLYDGINECGLAGDLQVLMECGRANADDLEQRGLQPILGEELVTYILTQYKDVAAVKELAATLALVDQPYSFMGQTAQISAHIHLLIRLAQWSFWNRLITVLLSYTIVLA